MYTPVDHKEKLCAHCSKVFKPKTSHQNFCKKVCYKRYGKIYKGHSSGAKSRNLNYRQFVKSFCEICGFLPKHLCQLDVHHLDGDRENNSIQNLQTLCANCHRLETAKQQGWFS